MTLFANSRFRFSDRIQIEDKNGEVNSVQVPRVTTSDIPDNTASFTTGAGDTFEKLADRFYQDASKWYVLADANPEIFYPLDLIAGTVIKVPPRSFAALQ